MPRLRVISADSHVVEPPDLWLERIDQAFRDRAPRLVHGPETDAIVCDGASMLPIGILAGAGRADDEVDLNGRWEQDVRRGSYDVDARRKDMELDGLDAEVVYPTLGLSLFQIEDPPFQQALFRAYNDWVSDFCKGARGWLKGVGLISTLDMDSAAAEVRRVRTLGLSGVMISVWPDESSLYDHRRYDPLWEAAEAENLPVSLHIATGTKGVGGTMPENIVLPVWVQRSLAAMILGGVFDRYPGLKIVSAEHDIGWVGNFIERMDYLTTRGSNIRRDRPFKLRPSEYVKRNIWLTFMRDLTGIASRHIIGVDRIMWSSDYPHHTATWPHSQQVLREHLADVPDDERRKIVCDNVATLYGFE